ncbi:MAG: TetR/AcrR family transcriptional regulator [Methanobacterium sp.]
MTHCTREKIMDAALKEFSEKGYTGAKTKEIADRSGLSEMTLFRRFGSKENLFNQVLKKNQTKAIEDFNSILEIKKNENSEDYFKDIIIQLWETTEENFEFLSLVILERQQISEDIIANMISILAEFMEDIFTDTKIDSKVFCFSILSFMYLSVLDKRLGRNIINHKDDFEEFINYSVKCL